MEAGDGPGSLGLDSQTNSLSDRDRLTENYDQHLAYPPVRQFILGEEYGTVAGGKGLVLQSQTLWFVRLFVVSLFKRFLWLRRISSWTRQDLVIVPRTQRPHVLSPGNMAIYP